MSCCVWGQLIRVAQLAIRSRLVSQYFYFAHFRFTRPNIAQPKSKLGKLENKQAKQTGFSLTRQRDRGGRFASFRLDSRNASHRKIGPK